MPIEVTDDMICAGYYNDQKGACYGDSGGPLVATDKNNRSMLVGIVSWGVDCLTSEYPSVFAKVSHIVDWVNENQFNPIKRSNNDAETRSNIKFHAWECCTYLQNISSVQNIKNKQSLVF